MPSLASFQLTPSQDSREFEQMLREYCNSMFPGMACLFARPGQKQYGVDVISPGPNGIVAIQCKDYQDACISTAMIDEWIQSAEEFKPQIDHFVIAIGGKTDGKIQKHVLGIDQFRRNNGLFSVEVLFWEEISMFLKMNPQILSRYYPFIKVDGSLNQTGIAYRNVNDLRLDFVELVLKYEIQGFLLEDPFVGIKTDYIILADQFDFAIKNLFQRAVLLQETEIYEKITVFYQKWNEYYGYLAKKVQPSIDGQFVKMNQVFQEDYETIDVIIQLLKDEIFKAYNSIIE